MNTIDKWKSKIKTANIAEKFNQIIKKGDEQDQSNPYLQETAQIKPIEDPPADQKNQEVQKPQGVAPKQTVTFSVDTMNEFSHEELQ